MKLPALGFLDPYRDRWRALAPRERLVVSVGAGVLAVILFYLLLWAPMQRELNRLRAAVPQDAVRVAQMRAQAMQVQQLRMSGARLNGGGSVLAVVEQTATARGFKPNITRMEPEGVNGANLAVDGVVFNTLVSWLNDLQVQHGMRVESASLDSAAGPGTVKGRLLLRGPAS
jgi:general secretion pathway protein M